MRKILVLLWVAVVFLAGCSTKQAEKVQQVQNLSNLKGKKIAVITGSPQDHDLSKLCTDAEIIRLPSHPDVLTAVSTGVADYFALDTTNTKLMGIEKLHLDLKFCYNENYGFGMAFRKEDTVLCAAFNNFLHQIQQDGTYDIVYNRWLTGNADHEDMPSIDLPQDGKVLRIAVVNNFPFTFIKNGEQAGFEIELMVRFAQYMQMSVSFDVYEISSVIQALAAKKVDIITSTLSITEERKKKVLFSEPYIYTADGIYGIEDVSNKILKVQRIEDINDQTIGVLQGSIFEKFCQNDFPNAKIASYNNYADMGLAIEMDHCDLLVISADPAQSIMTECKDIDTIGTVYSELYAATFRKSDTALCREFNEVLSKLYKTGEIYNIKKRCFNETGDGVRPSYNVPSKGEPIVVGTMGTNAGYCIVEKDFYGGYEPELALCLGEKLQRPVNFVTIDFGGLIPALTSGKIDMVLATIAITPEREKQVLFSMPYDTSAVYAITKVTNPDKELYNNSFFENVRESFYNNIIKEDRWKMVVDGFWKTVTITFFAIILGTLIGCLICWMRMRKNKLLQIIAKIYVEILRDVPILVFLMLMFYVVFAHSNITATWVAIIAFGMNFGAFTSVMFQTGIEGIDRGQREAGFALGFSKTGTFFNFILPQAMRNIVPVFKNEAVSLLKNTSVVGYIAIQDLTKVSDIIRSRTFDAFFPLIAVSIVYFIMAWLMGKGLDLLIRNNNKKKVRS